MKTLLHSCALPFAAAALTVGYLGWGEAALLQGGAAFGLAFLPAVATLAWVLHSYRADPNMKLLACLGGSGLRMAAALGGGVVLTKSRPDEFTMAFWGWLVAFYLAFLAFEMTLIVRQQSAQDAQPQA